VQYCVATIMRNTCVVVASGASFEPVNGDTHTLRDERHAINSDCDMSHKRGQTQMR